MFSTVINLQHGHHSSQNTANNAAKNGFFRKHYLRPLAWISRQKSTYKTDQQERRYTLKGQSWRIASDCNISVVLLTTRVETRVFFTKGKGKGAPYNRPWGPKRGSRGIALLVREPWYEEGMGWLAPRPCRFTPGKEIWMAAENLAPTWIRSPDRPARSESLYGLSYPGPLFSLVYMCN
jgi:hypothetical protein